MANTSDLFKNIQANFVFEDYHLHRAEIFFEAYDTSGPWQDDFFSSDMTLRHAPNHYYQMSIGTLVDEDGVWIPMMDENGQWLRYSGSLVVSYFDNSPATSYCSRTVFERYPASLVNPEELDFSIDVCSTSPFMCIHHSVVQKADNKMRVCDPLEDPLMIDLGRDGIKLGPRGRVVIFDYSGDGKAQLTQWVAIDGNEAFLVFDQNQNGIVDNGAELFGRGWLHLEQRLASNGFEQLKQYDHPLLGGNNDGYISKEDIVWSQLTLWLDSNADGISVASEMQPLSDYRLRNIELNFKSNLNRMDKAGNIIPYWSNAIGDKKHKIVDVFFKVLDN